MTHRLLVKLDVLKKYTRKRLAKYEKVESPSLGKVQLSPFVKTPLMVELKLDYELSPAGKTNLASTERDIERSHISGYHRERPKSVPAPHIARKKPARRPSSAPSNWKAKQGYQKEKLQTLDGGFVILKLNQKLKPLRFTTEVQKRPERVLYNLIDTCKYSRPNNQDESKTDTSRHCFPAAARRQDQQATVTMEKGEKTDQSSIHGEISNQDIQQLEKENKVRFSINGHLLPYGSNTSKDTSLEETLMPEGDGIKKSTVDSKDNGLKEKKSFIPLSIEDEIEKPNAKIIRVDLSKAKPQTPMTMSETHPVLCNSEGYLQEYILNKYVSQFRDKALHNRCVVFTQLNPILQNNYNETLAILRCQHFASRVIAKKKTMPPSFSQPKTLSAEILSRERQWYNPKRTQIGKPVGQKMPGSFTNANIPLTKENVKERNVSQTMSNGKKCEFVVCGVNLKADTCHEMGPAGVISGTKSQILASLSKSVTPFEEVPRKRVVVVDYIPISKPVKIYTFGDELSCQDSSLPFNNYSAINYFPEGKDIRKGRSDVNQDASGKKAFLGKTSPDRMEFSFDEDSEVSSTTISTSSRCFQKEENTSCKSQEQEKQPIILSPTRVISIPTAQCDVSESNRDLT